jgi:hypothetical protein
VAGREKEQCVRLALLGLWHRQQKTYPSPKQKFPEQVPEHFKIVPLPNKIISWLTSMLQRLPVKEQLRAKRMTTNIGLGIDGSSTLNPLESTMACFLMTSPSHNEPFSLEHLPLLCGRGDFRDQLMIPWLR